MSPLTSTKYILDTNILIDLNIWLPKSKFPKFWDKMHISLKGGKWVLLDVVADEIWKFQGKQDLGLWCSEQKTNKLITKTDACLDRSVEIQDAYNIVDLVKRKSEADPTIVAFAESDISIYKIFTRERHKGPGDQFFKMPDVCNILRIKYTRKVDEFYDHIDFKEK
jgi:hypothetical protein